MLQLHNVYVVSFVSQATSALVLSLLAFADRRSRWLVPLAAACGLHGAAIYLMPLWRGAGLWLPHAFSAAILVAMLYLIHLGLHMLVSPSRHRSIAVELVLVAVMILLFVLARYSSIVCVEASLSAAIVMLGRTVHMLWRARLRELRSPLSATALLLLAILVLFLVRIPLEPMVPAPPVLLLLREVTIVLLTLIAFSFLALYAAETRRRLHEESRMDVLTGLLNRRAMEEKAAEQVKVAMRHQRLCALLVLDLDDFKKLNDTWGHDVGDRALLAAGGLLLRMAGGVENCTVARMGGEEFAVLLSSGSLASAYELAGQICDGIAALRIAVGNQQVRFTVSIGLSALLPGEGTWTEMLRRADVAMYEAKREGRNRVMLCSELPETALSEEIPPTFARQS